MMKRNALLTLLFAFLSIVSFAQTKIDQTQPDKLVKTMLSVIKERNFKLLISICDPARQNDKETTGICSIYYKDELAKENFVNAFKNMAVFGDYTQEEGTDGELLGYVPIVFKTQDGELRNETFTCVYREGKWYLYAM